jgi:hypothetical protein
MVHGISLLNRMLPDGIQLYIKFNGISKSNRQSNMWGDCSSKIPKVSYSEIDGDGVYFGLHVKILVTIMSLAYIYQYIYINGA